MTKTEAMLNNLSQYLCLQKMVQAGERLLLSLEYLSYRGPELSTKHQRYAAHNLL